MLNLLISRYTFLTLKEKILLKDICGDSDNLLKLNIGDIGEIIGRKIRIKNWSVQKAFNEAEKTGEILAEGGVKCLFFQEPGYPPQLAEIYDPPFVLYYRGVLPKWDRPSAAVVGTRLASGIGICSAFELGFDFGVNNIRVVSGLALGIDSAAHSGNTAAGQGSVAVLGSGIDRIYPASNRKLSMKMLENGGIIMSEYPPGYEPRKYNFPERNRIISGLSRAVIVVEAPGRSGAMITAEFALEQGRDLFFHTAALRSTGNTDRIEELVYAGAPLIKNVGDIFCEWGFNEEERKLSLYRQEAAESTSEAGKVLAENMNRELYGNYIKFNGNYFRRACYESSYTTNS